MTNQPSSQVSSRVQITTGSRLHFGLSSLGGSAKHPWGGCGAMIDAPQVDLVIESADAWRLNTQNAPEVAKRVAGLVSRWQEQTAIPLRPGELGVQQVIPAHSGLGSGTQLALAVGEALCRWHGAPVPQVEELMALMGRGRRSGVGTYGYLQGGFLVDGGHRSGPPSGQSRLQAFACLPADWRFVLIRPETQNAGFSGVQEANAFDQLPAPPAETADALHDSISTTMLPAIKSGNFGDFAKSLGDFNRRSGEFFAAAQGSAYNGREIERVVQVVQKAGHDGVGQSSWGPTLFVAQPSEVDAQALVQALPSLLAAGGLEDLRVSLSVAQPLAHGRVVCER